MFNSTLIVIFHHKRCPPLETCMKKLSNVGFNRIWLIETGKNSWGKYQGPYERYIEFNISPHWHSLVQLMDYELPKEIERILFIDNDCFIIDPQDTVEYVTQYINEGYDIAALNGFASPREDKNNIIIPFELNKNNGRELYPDGIAYSIFSKEIWSKLEPTQEQFPADPGKFWTLLYKFNPKIGVHRMDIETKKGLYSGYPTNHVGLIRGYSQYEKEKWLHLGNLMTAYYAIENNKPIPCKLRRGFFCKFFPSTISFTDDERKEYIDIWNDFTWNLL